AVEARRGRASEGDRLVAGDVHRELLGVRIRHHDASGALHRHAAGHVERHRSGRVVDEQRGPPGDRQVRNEEAPRSDERPLPAPPVYASPWTLTIPALNTPPSAVGGPPALSHPSVSARPLMVTDQTPTKP